MKRFDINLPAMLVLGLSLFFFSCDKEEEAAPMEPPTIEWDSENSTYTVKVGKTVTISPVYGNVEGAVYAWKINGVILCTESTFSYTPSQSGDVYVELDVITEAGSAYAEAKISVVELAPPVVSLTIPSGGYKIIKEGELLLEPSIENTEGTTYVWYVNGSQKADTKEFKFSSAETGDYTLRLVAANEDGSDELVFNVKVCTAEELPFSWYFESEELNVAQGRKIRIKAWDIENAFDAEYIWKVNGKQEQKGPETEFVFATSDYTLSSEGVKNGDITTHEVTVTMKNSYTEITKTLKVNVCPAEGTYKRVATASSSAKFDKVYEFLAAPGQFVNEGYTAKTMEEAVVYAYGRMSGSNPNYVSLGGFGGYVVVGFDHSIENDGSYNLQIKGNSFAGSSEPGIVWVMQDENGDGLPNDTWYELKGSEYGKPESEIRDYAITYYRPKAPNMPVMWTDNQGKSGTVDYLGTFHRQAYYYPEWVSEDSYTLRGTCLVGRNRETSPGYWYNDDYDWGYVDNYSDIDRLTDDDNYSAAANGNHFKIEDAVTFDGQPANLAYIDFVKVVCAVNAKSGWLGELSCEVFDFKDFNILKKAE